MQLHPLIGNGQLLDAFLAPHAAFGNGSQAGAVMPIGKAAQNRLGNTAGDTKDNTAAGTDAERHIAGFRLNLVKGDAKVLNHPGQLGSGQYNICVLLAPGEVVRALDFRLFGGAGHNGYHKGLFSLWVVFRAAIVFLDDGGEHSLRRAAGGHILVKLREFVFHKLHPGGAAGGEQRQLFTGRYPLQEFLAFLHHRQVGGIAGVEHLVKAHAVQRSHNAPHGVGAIGQPEGFPGSHPDGGSNLSNHPNVGVTQSGVHFLQIGANGEGTGGAIYPALAAADAVGLL